MKRMESSPPHSAATFSSGVSQSNFLHVIVNTSRIVKVTVLLLVVFYFLTFSDTAFDVLSVVPGYVLPPNVWIWTLITHMFVQVHVVMLIVDICVIILSGKLLEPLWTSLELVIFFAVVCCSSALLSSVAYLVLYSVTGNTNYLFETHIYGLAAYIGGFCVVTKQLMPDETLLRLPFGKLQNRHMPLLCVVVSGALSLAKILNGPYAMQYAFGVLTSWIYLRFYQRHGNGSKGDMAENFSFASFFPPPLEVFVAVFSNTVFSLLMRLGICKNPQRNYNIDPPVTLTVTLPGTDPADAERRRQLAIKALDERLSKAGEEASWPGLEDEDAVNGQLEEVVVSSTDPASSEGFTSTPLTTSQTESENTGVPSS